MSSISSLSATVSFVYAILPRGPSELRKTVTQSARTPISRLALFLAGIQEHVLYCRYSERPDPYLPTWQLAATVRRRGEGVRVKERLHKGDPMESVSVENHRFDQYERYIFQPSEVYTTLQADATLVPHGTAFMAACLHDPGPPTGPSILTFPLIPENKVASRGALIRCSEMLHAKRHIMRRVCALMHHSLRPRNCTVRRTIRSSTFHRRELRYHGKSQQIQLTDFMWGGPIRCAPAEPRAPRWNFGTFNTAYTQLVVFSVT
jgi:hypothetical protein